MLEAAATIAASWEQVKQQLPKEQVVGWVRQQLGEHNAQALGQVLSAILDGQVDQLLGRGRWEGIRTSHLQPGGEVICGRCGAQAPGYFYRDGHWRRWLVTPAGAVQIRVPMLECRQCRAAGQWEHGLWARLERLSRDWAELVLAWVQLGSLRGWAQWLAEQMGVQVAPSTLAARLAQAERAYEQWRRRPLPELPAVLVVDGLHFTLGKGPGQQGAPVCAVAAIGYWPEQGRAELLDFELGSSENEATCREMFARLAARGWQQAPGLLISDDNAAYRAAAEAVWGPVSWQLCLKHKLRNVRQQAPAGCKRQMVAEAREIFAAPTRPEAQQRAQEWAQRWRWSARGAVQSLLRNLDLCLTYYDYPPSWWAGIRTNNAAESAMNCLRSALRRAGGCPGSRPGALGILLAAALSFNCASFP